jgi:hypothetical protein
MAIFASEGFRRVFDALDRLLVVHWSPTSTSIIDDLMCFSVFFNHGIQRALRLDLTHCIDNVWGDLKKRSRAL